MRVLTRFSSALLVTCLSGTLSAECIAPSFVQRPGLGTPPHPDDIVIARLDNFTSNPQVITAHASADRVSVLYLFGSRFDTVTFTVENPQTVAVADMNNDGDRDLVTGSSGAVRVHRGTGGRVWPLLSVWSFATNTPHFAIGDANGDRELDIAGVGPLVNILDGSRSAIPTTNRQLGDGAWRAVDVGLGDLDGNGEVDVVAYGQPVDRSNPSFLAVYYRTGGVYENPPQLLTLPANTYGRLTIGDTDYDGDLDLVAGNGPAELVTVFTNMGNRVYAVASYGTLNHRPGKAAIADVTQDGRPDLVFASTNGTGIPILVENGRQSFTVHYVPLESPAYPLDFSGVAVSDMNEDGKPDVYLTVPTQDAIYRLHNTCPGNSSVELYTSRDPAFYGEPIQLFARLFGYDIFGTVVFRDGDTVIGTVPVTGGGWGILELTPAPGTHRFTATHRDKTSAPYVQTILRHDFGPPLGLVAMSDASGNVDVTWAGAYGSSSYQVSRKTGGGAWSILGTTAQEIWQDTIAPGTAAFYRVSATGGGQTTANSLADCATAIAFNPDLARDSLIKASDLIEIRTATNLVRAAAGLSPASFTDPSPARRQVKTVHITELRSALGAALTAVTASPPALTPPPAFRSPILAIHWLELRAKLQ